MRMLALLLVPISAMLVVAQGETKTATDTTRVQGEWTVERAVRNGKELPKEFREKMKFRFEKDNVIINDGNNDEKAVFKFDPSKTPKQIDISPKGEEGRTIPGIYELKGDTLKIAFTGPGADRPTEFKATETVSFLELKRKK